MKKIYHKRTVSDFLPETSIHILANKCVCYTVYSCPIMRLKNILSLESRPKVVGKEIFTSLAFKFYIRSMYLLS